MTLSTEIAAARPEQEREMLERLYDACPHAWQGGNNYATFTAMLDCGAFLSAAEMLVDHGNGWHAIVAIRPDGPQAQVCNWYNARQQTGLIEAKNPALALAAAIAKSLEEG